VNTIFHELDTAAVSWKLYYVATHGFCLAGNACGAGSSNYPVIYLNHFTYFHKYLYQNSSHVACTAQIIGFDDEFGPNPAAKSTR
jgi:hypothetical protein